MWYQDAPGEYYIDEAALKLYFLPPKASSESRPDGSTAAANEQLILSVNGSTALIDITNVRHLLPFPSHCMLVFPLILATFLQVKHVNLANLTVAYLSRATSMPQIYTPKQGNSRILDDIYLPPE